jgi:hypothetical protein
MTIDHIHFDDVIMTLSKDNVMVLVAKGCPQRREHLQTELIDYGDIPYP